jgi:hypothetical protein
MNAYHHIVCYIKVDQECIKQIIKDLDIKKEDDYDKYKNVFDKYDSDNEDNYIYYCSVKHGNAIVKKYFEIKNINTKLNFILSYIKNIKFFEISNKYCCDELYTKEKTYDNERYKRYLFENFNFNLPIFMCTINDSNRAKIYIEKMNYFFKNNKENSENIPLYKDIDKYMDFIKWLGYASEVCYTFENKFIIFENDNNKLYIE